MTQPSGSAAASRPSAYSAAGVDIEAGDRAVELMKEWVAKTRRPEVVGGLGLVLGVLLPVVGVLLAAVMVGALVTAHLSNGFFSSDGGFEYVLVLAAASLALGFSGPRYTLPALFRGKAQEAERVAA